MKSGCHLDRSSLPIRTGPLSAIAPPTVITPPTGCDRQTLRNYAPRRVLVSGCVLVTAGLISILLHSNCVLNDSFMSELCGYGVWGGIMVSVLLAASFYKFSGGL